MGAQTFLQVAKGKTVEKAFRAAVDDAAWEHGHGGYTGTIVEKHSYVVIEVPKQKELMKIMDATEWRDHAGNYARDLIDDLDERIHDKWGPAGAIKLAEDTWLFFGWASS